MFEKCTLVKRLLWIYRNICPIYGPIQEVLFGQRLIDLGLSLYGPFLHPTALFSSCDVGKSNENIVIEMGEQCFMD